MRYFLAPRSGEKSYANFESTIKSGIPLSRIEAYLDSTGHDLVSQQDVIYAWGNREGTASQWNKMEPGDKVIFYAKGRLVSVGEMYYKQESDNLALAMWPPDENGNPWKYTFFLKNITPIDIPIRAFNALALYKPTFIVQGFTEILPHRVEAIAEKYGSVDVMLDSFTEKDHEEVVQEGDKVYYNVPKATKITLRSEFQLELPKESSKPGTKKSPFKTDYISKAKKSAKTGNKGEALVEKYEKDFLVQQGRRDLANLVKRVSLEDDSLGYDIESFESDGTPKYIEVKSTITQTSSIRFFLSPNERKIGRSLPNYYIYFIDGVFSQNPCITPIKNPFSDNNASLKIEPSEYIVTADIVASES